MNIYKKHPALLTETKHEASPDNILDLLFACARYYYDFTVGIGEEDAEFWEARKNRGFGDGYLEVVAVVIGLPISDVQDLYNRSRFGGAASGTFVSTVPEKLRRKVL